MLTLQRKSHAEILLSLTEVSSHNNVRIWTQKINALCYLFRFSSLLSVLAQDARGQQVEKGFIEDMIMGLGHTKPAFVFNPDQTQIVGWTSSQTSAMISATGNNPMEANKIKDQLRLLIATDEVDIIFFLSSGQEDLIRNIVND